MFPSCESVGSQVVPSPTGTVQAQRRDRSCETVRSDSPMTAEQKAAAAAKRKATRTARQTMGKNQKKTVQGSVTAKLVVTPVAPSSGAAPVASPEPVGNAPPGVTTAAPAAPVTPHS